MPVQVQHFACTVPPGTPVASPVTIPTELGIFQVTFIEVNVPSGFNGQVGFYIASSGQQVLPFRSGATPNWLILNDTEKHWDLEDQPDSGDWAIVAYNTGNFPHTLYVTFGVNPVALDTTITLAPISDIQAAGNG